MLQQEVASLLDQFMDMNQRCIKRVRDGDTGLKIHMADWPEFANIELDPLAKLTKSLQDLEIRPGDDARKTRSYPGIIEADTATIELFCALNECKTNFKVAMQRLKNESPKSHRLFCEYVKTGINKTREERFGRGFGPLSLNHIYRHFVILQERPRSVSYSWTSRSSSMVIVTKKEAIRALEDLNEAMPHHLEIQRGVLAQLPDTEPLVKVIPTTAGAKANVVYRNGQPATFKPALPIMIPQGDEAVRMKFLSAHDVQRKSSRLQRTDKKVEDTPIAPSIHLYRYKEDFRSKR